MTTIQLSQPVRSVGNHEKGWMPALTFAILIQPDRPVGEITLRLGNTDWITHYAGHIGYHIDAGYQGSGYATQACLLLRPIAVEEGFGELWITCNPANWASRKVCEKIGAQLIELVDLPAGNDMYEKGERQKCRYRWTLTEQAL